jgi:hypothetical protein
MVEVMASSAAVLDISFNEILREAVARDPTVFREWHINKRSAVATDHATKIAAVVSDGMNLQYIDADDQTDELCLAAVNNNGLAYQHVAVSKRTEQIKKAAVAQNGLALQFIPDLSDSLVDCSGAVRNNGLALEFVSPAIRGQLAEAAVNQTIFSLKFVPSDMPKYDDIALGVVSKYGFLLKDVVNPSKQICMEAIKNMPKAIQFVPVGISR